MIKERTEKVKDNQNGKSKVSYFQSDKVKHWKLSFFNIANVQL
jgi:hypothetical protein